ncbi:CBS domain-containing protein [Candidatus Bathyarchaeota archaeon]|nr:CBS domain-containing protein [Candidatus Bathyarchaeota archaeon]
MSQRVRVYEVMTHNPLTVSLNDNLEKVVQMMNRFRVGSIIVVDEGRPLGIVTERDILVRVVAKGKLAIETWVKDVMSKPIITIPENAYVEAAAKKMVKEGVKRLAVTRNGLLVGIITSTDIVKAVAAGLLTQEVYLYLSDIFKKPPLSGTVKRQGRLHV